MQFKQLFNEENISYEKALEVMKYGSLYHDRKNKTAYIVNSKGDEFKVSWEVFKKLIFQHKISLSTVRDFVEIYG